MMPRPLARVRPTEGTNLEQVGVPGDGAPATVDQTLKARVGASVARLVKASRAAKTPATRSRAEPGQPGKGGRESLEEENTEEGSVGEEG